MGERRRIRRRRLDARVLEERERRHPRLDVARAPVVDEHEPEDVVGEGLDRNRVTELGGDADDEPELELEVEASARAEGRRALVRRLLLAARAHDVRAADDDAARTAVVRDGKPAPVRQQRLPVGPEHAAEVCHVLERGVEVDVVRDLEREACSCLARRDARPVVEARGGDRLLPCLGARGEQLVQRRPGEHVAKAREVDDLAVLAPREAAGLERAEPRHGRIPSRSSSSTGSKNEHVPIEWKSEARASASRAGDASRSRQRSETASRANARGRSRSASSSSPKTAATRRLRKPCSPPSVGYAWWSPAVALKTSPRERQPWTNSASSSTVGTRSPPQRIFARRPRPATSSSGTPSR